MKHDTNYKVYEFTSHTMFHKNLDIVNIFRSRVKSKIWAILRTTLYFRNDSWTTLYPMSNPLKNIISHKQSFRKTVYPMSNLLRNLVSQRNPLYPRASLCKTLHPMSNPFKNFIFHKQSFELLYIPKAILWTTLRSMSNPLNNCMSHAQHFEELHDVVVSLIFSKTKTLTFELLYAFCWSTAVKFKF